MDTPVEKNAVRKQVLTPARRDEWVISTYTRDDFLLVVVFRYGEGDFRIGTFGLPRTAALDLAYATLEAAQDAASEWLDAVYPEAPRPNPHPGLTDDDIPF